MPRLAVIIPAYNEAAAIGGVVQGALAQGADLVVVVDDGSRDATADAAERAGAQVVRQANGGYDAALNAGFAAAAGLGADQLVTMDADGQHDPSLLPRFRQLLDEGAWLVAGERPACARWAERIYALVARRWGLRDPLCGMKGYRIGLWRELGCFDAVRSIGSQLAVHAARRGKPISRLPITIRPRQDGETRFGGGWRANRRILGAMWRVIRATAR